MRKSITALTDDEWTTVVEALNAMKASGVYDEFTRRHMDAMMDLTLLPGEVNTQRNSAHRGPVFLPWHRQSLLEFELALGVDVPYWDWESEGSSWRTSAIWDRVGGDGSTGDGRITDGPFASWTSILYQAGAYVQREGIIRDFAPGGSMVPVPTDLAIYDAAPWSELNSPRTSFRQALESEHNNVHNFVGGDMVSGTSPNDPLFWFHHCNVERIYWRWQQQHGFGTYAPTNGGPPGHNRNDVMRHLGASVTVASVLDPRPLGPTYDALETTDVRV